MEYIIVDLVLNLGSASSFLMIILSIKSPILSILSNVLPSG